MTSVSAIADDSFLKSPTVALMSGSNFCPSGIFSGRIAAKGPPQTEEVTEGKTVSYSSFF